jgi:hypothetical protein
MSGAARTGSERLGGSVADQQREEGKGGGLGVGVPRGAGVSWGLAPTGGRCPAGQSRGERELTGGPRHSAGRRGQPVSGRAWAGPRRNGDGPLGCTVRFYIYLN